ncbi:unnamed protein product [Hydatigera taeniaeformis]|uniref:Uncharacterized protein n=1 Tax=Hydatigena taeniaeformis TaxID=6205 RepID=A0A0R3X4T1_HYDTA|nr:unnamed protein product [Hydatigera taeniaeformis]
MTKVNESKAAFLAYPSTSRSLTQKVFIISTIVTLCTVVTIIALILIRSRKSQFWSMRKPAHLQRRCRRQSKWKRYDGFQPLNQDELRGLGSTFGSAIDEDDEDEEEAVMDSNTIIDIRKFGPQDSQQHSSKLSVQSCTPTRKNDLTSASSHHVDT